ncbi:2774_t:CDS:2 [Diversispora eburnea]|uniref:2774_t:CDS:1 n=1 Tax=Diversispora eburnea TaxID=1213867 RepID=A0A9N9C0V4_9GLOM|nr:2774_t:CDS:2 [Diversispora eburnea]
MYKIHKYFERIPTVWDVLDFLYECDIEPFDAKVDSYTKGLEAIANHEQGERAERAQFLHDRFKNATKPRNQYWRTGDFLGYLMQKGPDRKKATEWEKRRSKRQVNINQPIKGNVGNVIGNVNGNINTEKIDQRKDSVDTFFQDPSDQRSTSFIEKLRESKIIGNKTRDEEDKVESESLNSFSASESLNSFSIFLDSNFISFCNTSDADESTSDASEDNDDLDCNNNYENEDDLPKVDKVAFCKAHDSIPNTTKLKLSTGKIVEDVLFEFAKDMDYEHHAHSYIVDFDDEDIKALFTDSEWKELTKDRIGVPPISQEITKELARYGNSTLEDLRTKTMTSYLEEEKYDIRKHYDKEWIQLAIRTLVNLYENIDAPLIRTQYEDWFTVALLGMCIDFCLRDIRLGTDIKRTDAPSLSSANRKNRNRANTRTRKLTGRKIDGIIYTADGLLEFGAIEGARSFTGVSDNKYLNETFKMPKTLRDMYADLIRVINYDDQRADKLQVIGILHLGLWVQFVRLWRAGGSICIFRKDPKSFNLSSKFSKKGLNSFLKFLAKINQYKV